MKAKKITYWVLLALFALMNLGDGIAGIMHEKNGVEAMKQLGYPLYVLTIVGSAKLIGIIVLLQNKFKAIKEWAFAGFTISCLGAFLSWVAVHGPVFNMMFPPIILTILLIIYGLWKKLEKASAL